MHEGTIGRRYARALAMSLTKESDERLEKVEGELSAVAALLDRHSGHREFRQAMLNPSFSVSQRRGIVTELGKSQKLEAATVGFLALLVDKERIPQLLRLQTR